MITPGLQGIFVPSKDGLSRCALRAGLRARDFRRVADRTAEMLHEWPDGRGITPKMAKLFP